MWKCHPGHHSPWAWHGSGGIAEEFLLAPGTPALSLCRLPGPFHLDTLLRCAQGWGVHAQHAPGWTCTHSATAQPESPSGGRETLNEQEQAAARPSGLSRRAALHSSKEHATAR